MQKDWTVRDRITSKLISFMKYGEKDFLHCKWNDFIIMLLNKFGSDPEAFANKVLAMRSDN